MSVSQRVATLQANLLCPLEVLGVEVLAMRVVVVMDQANKPLLAHLMPSKEVVLGGSHNVGGHDAGVRSAGIRVQ